MWLYERFKEDKDIPTNMDRDLLFEYCVNDYLDIKESKPVINKRNINVMV